MQGTKPPTFRPTVWPAEPPRVPPIRLPNLVEVEPGIYAFRREPETFVDIPTDFVLQELLDTSDATNAELVAFTNRWGLVASLTSKYAFRHLREQPAVKAQKKVLEEAESRHPQDWLIPLAAIDLSLRNLRSLVSHLLAYLEGAGDDAIVAAWTREGAEVQALAGLKPPDVSHAWWLWEHYLNLGLEAFPVHVRTGHPDFTGAPGANLFNACCLQIATYLAGEGRVYRCANERCGRPFTRQRGRAREEYGQHRSRGVRYCSHLCAKAQSERDRRRRRAEERNPS